MTRKTPEQLTHQTVALVIEGPMGSGIGSGVLVSLNGIGLKEGAKIPRASTPDMVLTNDDILIITCEHCIPRGARSMMVEITGGKRFIADALLVDGRADVALMKIRDVQWDAANDFANEFGMYPATIGDSDKVALGTEVLAIGNPLMLEYSFSATAGIISKTKAYNSLSILPTFLTNTLINPGNSGGMLARKDTGEWIGMNSSGLFGAGGGNRGLNHAIRSNEILFWIKRMAVQKKVVRDGITSLVFQHINVKAQKKLDLDSTKGALISGVADDELGVGGKLRRADVVQCVDILYKGKLVKSVNVDSPQDCIYAFQMAAGMDVEVTIVRYGKTKKLKFQIPMELMPFANQATFDPFGMEVQTYRGNKGVQVTNIHPYCPLYPVIDRYDVIIGVEDPEDPSKTIPITNRESFYQVAAKHGSNSFWVEVNDLAGFLLERIKEEGQLRMNSDVPFEEEDYGLYEAGLVLKSLLLIRP